MGYLHEGHLRLVDRARELSERVVVSIFVNPLQFGPSEDLARYPRDLERDRKLATARGVDCLFVPEASAMYPRGGGGGGPSEPLARIVPGPVAETLEGAARPGHFTGVLTVVAGTSRPGFSGDTGPATSARLNNPQGIALDSAGNIYIADAGNNCIRTISPAGIITTFAGNQIAGYYGDGFPATSAALPKRSRSVPNAAMRRGANAAPAPGRESKIGKSGWALVISAITLS